MLSNTKNLKFDIFGESHALEIGVKINGLPANLEIDEQQIQDFVDRRKSGNNPWSTPRKEDDKVIIVNGVINGKTNGEELIAVIKNSNQKSKDYSNLLLTPRPSHADYVAIIKDKDKVNLAGGGRFSGRMTAPLCIIGAIAINILKSEGIEIAGFVSQIGNIKSKSYKSDIISLEEIRNAQKSNFPVLENKEEMENLIFKARDNGDSIGGIIECMVFNMPVGIGDAMFDGLESRISDLVYGIPAVKGVEFGSGFDLGTMFGSVANDQFCYKDGKVVTKSNHNGGINGGISNGMEITLRIAIKPTPSIFKEQNSINIKEHKNTKIQIKGRHDACIVPRAVAPVESAVAVAILDAYLDSRS